MSDNVVVEFNETENKIEVVFTPTGLPGVPGEQGPEGPAGPEGPPGSATVPLLPEFVAQGMSLVAQGSANGPKWVDGVASDINVTPYNGGVAGRGSTEIVIAMGALDPAITIPGNAIPASGSVTVTMVTGGVFRPQITSWNVTALGVPCVLSHDAGSAADPTNPDSPVGVFTFQLARVTPGSPVVFPPGTTVHCTEFDSHRLALLTALWLFTNNPASDPTSAYAIRDMDLAIAYARGKVIMATEHLRTNETQTAWKKYTNGIVRSRRSRPGELVDLELIMGNWAIVLAGLNATTSDKNALALGQSPPSIMSDTGSLKTHFNSYGYAVVRQAWTQAAALQAVVPGMIPAVKPDISGAAATPASPTVDGFTATIPSAINRATAYHWEYRKQGLPNWMYGPNSLGLTAVFSGLESGTTYEYRYAACNIDGFGPSSAVGTVATSGTAPVIIASDSGSGAAATNMNSPARSTDQLVAFAPGGAVKPYTTINSFTGKTLDGQFYLSGGASSQAIIDAGVLDHAIEFTVGVLPTSGSLGWIMSYLDATHFLIMTLSSLGTLQLRYNAGSGQVVAATSPTGTFTAGSRGKLRRFSNGLYVQINGIDSISSTDAAIAGIVSNKSGFQVAPGAYLRDPVWSDR